MRIIGGHDYYDVGLSQGRDDDVIFKRSTWPELSPGPEPTVPELRVLVSDKHGNKTSFRTGRWNTGLDKWRMTSRGRAAFDGSARVSYYKLAVNFAGSEYYGLSYEVGGFPPPEDSPRVIWTLRDLDRVLRRFYDYRVVFDGADVTLLFKPSVRREFMVERGASIAVWSYHPEAQKSGWTFDCTGLRELNFQRVLDPWAAWQELSMWVANLARPDRPMVQLSDQDVAKKHGYDKWSFRRMPAPGK